MDMPAPVMLHVVSFLSHIKPGYVTHLSYFDGCLPLFLALPGLYLQLKANPLFLQVIYDAWEHYNIHQCELWLDRF